MQENKPTTPKSRRGRLRTNSTPQTVKACIADVTLTNARPVLSRHRATMAPGDFIQPQSLITRMNSRSALLSSQTFLEAPKRQDLESKDTELKLLYDGYLQSMMTEIIIKKKIEERKNKLTMQLATVARENELDEEKLLKIKTREQDIINLTKLQNEVDAQIVEVDKDIDKEGRKAITETLSRLHVLLKPLDVLRCENILLPENEKEWEDMNVLLKKCLNCLESIGELIGSKSDVYEAVGHGSENFVKTYKDIESLQKRLQEALCNLQVLVLKDSMYTLSQSDM